MRTLAQKPTVIPEVKSPESTNRSRALSERSHGAHHLQPAVGNQAAWRLRRAETDEPEANPVPSVPRFSYDFSQIPLHPKAHASIQPKVAISAPGDVHEEEADRVARRVMRMSDLEIQRKCACGGGCPNCQAGQAGLKDRLLPARRDQTNIAGETGAPAIVNEALRSPGTALDPSTRSFFEPRFGHDFGHVRIHTGAQAAESARAIHAKAYTFGRNIVFGSGQYDPQSAAGKSLLAHELMHVRQQAGARGARIDRFVACGPPENCPPRDSGEENTARTEPMSVNQVSDPFGILVANFAVGSAVIKPGLTTSPNFNSIQSGMRQNPDFRWEILGFSDCEGGEATNSPLRTERAYALGAALAADLRPQIEGIRGAPIGDCMQSNATAAERRLNRSAFLQRTVTAYTLPEVVVEATPDLYGVTSPASQYFVRASPNGEIIGRLVLREMRARVIGESGTNVDDLWLQVRFTREDMATIQAAYNRDMAARAARLPNLQTRRTGLQQHITQMQRRPGMPFEVQGQIAQAREALAPIENEIQQIEAYQRRLAAPYTGLTAWVGAAALGVVAMHYDNFLNLVDQFDLAHANEPLRDRLTRLRQYGEDASLEGDRVVGRGGDLPNRVTQSDRTNTSNWDLFFEGKQIRMPDGSFIDAHHFILGLDALALPRSDQSSSRVLRDWAIATVDVGESWSATTWSGDVGGAVGDYVLHKSGAWEAANTRDDNETRLRFYFETRAPNMDLLADIDSWGAFGAIPRTNQSISNFTTLRQIFEATYGPADQTAQEYNTQITPPRRQGVHTFLCNYGFTSPTDLVTQTAARARVLEQVKIFATGWYDVRASSTGVNTVFGRSDETDSRILTASGQMTDMFLNWLQALASTSGLTSMTCG